VPAASRDLVHFGDRTMNCFVVEIVSNGRRCGRLTNHLLQTVPFGDFERDASSRGPMSCVNVMWSVSSPHSAKTTHKPTLIQLFVCL
jgi:hypothetical protein